MPLNNDKVLSMLGLAKRAGKIASGEAGVEKAVQEGSAFLVVLAGDASANTRKKMTNKCAYYEVPLLVYADKKSLGSALGCEYRASAAVTDEGFARAVREKAGDIE